MFDQRRHLRDALSVAARYTGMTQLNNLSSYPSVHWRRGRVHGGDEESHDASAVKCL